MCLIGVFGAGEAINLVFSNALFFTFGPKISVKISIKLVGLTGVNAPIH